MKTQTSKRSIWLRTIALLPLISILLFSFSDKVEVPKEESNIAVIQTFQEKASPEMIAEYNTLAKKYNTMSKDKFHVTGEEVERMDYIYGTMTDDQKAEAEPYPDLPSPPPAPEVLNGEEMNVPPPPPAVPDVIEIEEEVEVMEEMVAMEEQVVQMEKQAIEMKEQAAQMEKQVVAMERHILETPPLPPPPKSPLEFVKEMAEQNAIFYYDGKKITTDRAIKILKKSDHINLEAKHTGLKRPVVKLSTKPMVLEN